MKIIRVRRGYTTNSSAYTEWLPPPQNGGAGQAAQGGSGAATAGSAPPAQVARPPAPSPGAATAVPPPGAPAATAPSSPAAGNSLVFAGLAAALAGVFVTERVIRRLRRRRKDEGGDE